MTKLLLTFSDPRVAKRFLRIAREAGFQVTTDHPSRVTIVAEPMDVAVLVQRSTANIAPDLITLGSIGWSRGLGSQQAGRWAVYVLDPGKDEQLVGVYPSKDVAEGKSAELNRSFAAQPCTCRRKFFARAL